MTNYAQNSLCSAPFFPLGSRPLRRQWYGNILFVSWFGFLAPGTALQAQTTSPSQTALTASATSSAASDAPLPTKVLGQVPDTAKYGTAVEIADIVQGVVPFHSPYFGTNSLLSRKETELNHSITLYLGARPTPRFEVYVNPEIALGTGISTGDGLAGYSNGNLLGRPTLSSAPYLARAFVRWRIPLQPSDIPKQKQSVTPGDNLIGGSAGAERSVSGAQRLPCGRRIGSIAR